MKKSTKYLLGVGAAVALAAGLYVPDAVEEAREKKAEEKEKARQEQLAEQKRIEDERAAQLEKEAKAVYAHARDSVRTAMGYDDTVFTHFSETEEKMRKIAGLNQKTILRQNVDTLIAQHCRQTAKEIINFLDKYNIHVYDYEKGRKRSDQEVVEEFAYAEYFDYAGRRTGAKEYPEYAEPDALKAKMPWRMFGNSRDEYDKYAIDWKDSEYGGDRRQEIQNGVLKIFDKMNANLDNALRAECKKFAVYYPMLDLSKSGIPAEYAKLYKDYDPIDYIEGEGDSGFAFEYAEPNISINREVSVYDSKLKVDFFGEDGATYELIKIADGKWQVVKTDKDGRVTKTPVFSHNVDYEYTMNSWGKHTYYEYDEEKGEYVLHTYSYGDNKEDAGDHVSFYPGPNMGVHVSSWDVVWGKKAVKSDEYPDPKGKIVAKRDSLAKEAAYLRKQNDKMWQISDVADSVARVKRQAYLARQGQRGH